MAAEAAALLDQLMGATRNANPGDDLKQPEWWDSEVWQLLLNNASCMPDTWCNLI